MADIIPADTDLYQQLAAAATTRRCLVFAGLPGIGKSLLTRQASHIARAAGRTVTWVQWDVVRRECFEIEPFISRHPERAGLADPIMRLAVDGWLRHGVSRWHAGCREDELLLIEAPLIGGRLVSLLRPENDGAENLLASEQSLFLLPVPTIAVKDALRGKRGDSKNADPRQADASVTVLDGLVEEINAAGVVLGVAKAGASGYAPATYASVFLHAMRHRHCLQLSIDRVFAIDAAGVDDGPAPAKLSPSPEAVARAFATAEAMPSADRSRHLDSWYL